MNSKEIVRFVDELSRDKDISREALAEALKDAILAAVTKKIGKYLEAEVEVDIDKGIIEIFVPKEVSESEKSNWYEITVEEAKALKDDPQYGDILMVPTPLESLGRQAALVAKQKLLERLKDFERTVIMDEYEPKIGEIVNGVILKTDRNNIIVNLGKTEAVLPKREMIPGEFFGRGDYVRAILLDIRVIKNWPQLILSRTHPLFIKKLFEAEIPEVFEGIITVHAVAREPGDRAKVAVSTNNPNIDPRGACIGMKGSRITSISNELKGEKIDVIEWSPDAVEFVCNAISPAQVILTNIIEDDKTLEVIVPDDQLSLAIGKRGQNVKLAAMLTEWRLDVLKESEYAQIRNQRLIEQAEEMKQFYVLYNLENILTLTPEKISALIESGIDDVIKLSDATVDEVKMILNLSDEDAVGLINQTIDYLTEKLEEMESKEIEQELSVDEGAESESGELVNSDEPVNNDELVNNDEPANSGELVNSDEPVNSGELVNSDKPVNSGELVNSDEPVNSDELVNSDEPVNNDELGNIDELIKPSLDISALTEEIGKTEDKNILTVSEEK